MAELPEEIEILGRRCPIDWSASLKAGPEEEKPWGEYHPMHCQIAVDKGVPSNEFRLRTLIHEMTHAGLDVSGLAQFMDIKLEEALCTVMEQLILPNIETLYKINRFIPKKENKK